MTAPHTTTTFETGFYDAAGTWTPLSAAYAFGGSDHFGGWGSREALTRRLCANKDFRPARLLDGVEFDNHHPNTVRHLPDLAGIRARVRFNQVVAS